MSCNDATQTLHNLTLFCTMPNGHDGRHSTWQSSKWYEWDHNEDKFEPWWVGEVA